MLDGEIDLWSRLTSKKLTAAGKAPTSHEEMSMFAACLLAVTQAPKKGGIVWVFDEMMMDYSQHPIFVDMA